MSKCQVKDCENEAIGFICDHDDGDHDICQECVDKYYKRGKEDKMPFVEPKNRPELDKVYKAMIDAGIKADGDLNYILYKFCKYQVDPSYNNYKNYFGELTECVAQCRQDFLVPYEKMKKVDNGDV